jgi:hypothetical protein
MSSSAEQNNWLSDLRCYQAIKDSLAGRHDHIAKAYQQQWPNFIIIGSAKSCNYYFSNGTWPTPGDPNQSIDGTEIFWPQLQTWMGMVRDNNSPAQNATACVGKQARCTPPLTAPINTHHNSSAIISASFH